MYQQHQSPYPMSPPVPVVAGSSGGSIDPSILGLLRNMEKEDLQRLDERTIDSLLADDKELRDLADQKVTEHASNRSLAEHSLTFQSRLDQSRRSLTAAHKEAAEQARIHRELRDRLQRGGRQPGESAENLHTLLQSACLEAEESGEAILDAFLAGRMQLAEFATAYTAARVLYHTRRTKSDKVTEISNQRIAHAAAPFRTTELPHQQQQHHNSFQPPPPPPPQYQQQQPQQQGQAYGMPPYYYPSPPSYQPYQQSPFK